MTEPITVKDLKKALDNFKEGYNKLWKKNQKISLG